MKHIDFISIINKDCHLITTIISDFIGEEVNRNVYVNVKNVLSLNGIRTKTRGEWCENIEFVWDKL